MTSWAAPDSGLRPRTCSSASVLLRPGTDTASAMLPPRTALLWTLVLAAGFLGLGARRPPQRPSPISAIQPKAGFDAQQVEPGAGGRRRLAPLRREGQAGSPIPSGLTPLPPVCRDLVPRGRGLLLSLPAGAGPPCGGHRSEGGAPGCSHGCQHLPEAVSSARPHGHPSPDHPPPWPVLLPRAGARASVLRPSQGWHLLAGSAALQRHEGPGPLPAPR